MHDLISPSSSWIHKRTGQRITIRDVHQDGTLTIAPGQSILVIDEAAFLAFWDSLDEENEYEFDTA